MSHRSSGARSTNCSKLIRPKKAKGIQYLRFKNALSQKNEAEVSIQV